jgi:AAA lid domain
MMAARAYAALEEMDTVTNECLRVVAHLALQHRRQEMGQIVAIDVLYVVTVITHPNS